MLLVEVASVVLLISEIVEDFIPVKNNEISDATSLLILPLNTHGKRYWKLESNKSPQILE